LEDHPEIAVLGTWAHCIDLEGRPTGREERAPVEPAEMTQAVPHGSIPVHGSILARTAALRAVGGYRPFRYVEDYDLWLRLTDRADRVAVLPEFLYELRRGGGEETARDRPSAWVAMFLVKEAALRRRAGRRDPLAGLDYDGFLALMEQVKRGRGPLGRQWRAVPYWGRAREQWDAGRYGAALWPLLQTLACCPEHREVWERLRSAWGGLSNPPGEARARKPAPRVHPEGPRIVYVKDYLMYSGGAEQLFTQLAVAAQQHGYDSVVVLRWPAVPDNKYVTALRAAGIAVHGAPGTRFRLTTAALEAAAGVLQTLAWPAFLIKARGNPRQAWGRAGEGVRARVTGPALERARNRWFWRALDRVHAERPVQVLHAHDTDRATPPAARWAVDHGAVLLSHDHAGPARPRRFERFPCTYSPEEVALLARHATIVTVSEAIRQAAAPAYGEGARLVAMPNWMIEPPPAPPPAPRPAEFTVGMITRMAWEKGVLVFLDALALLPARGVAVRGLLVGSGPLMGALPEEVRQRGLEGLVELRGDVPRQQVWGALEELDVFVLPSFEVYESVPMCILEAMAQGLPVVGTAVGGIPEVVRPGVNGLLVPEGDSQALADALQELAGDPERRRRMGEASRAIWESEYTEAAVWPRWDALYRSLLAGVRGAPDASGGDAGCG
jgi:glycosyltransferase involved in cell wall biosynthesis